MAEVTLGVVVLLGVTLTVGAVVLVTLAARGLARGVTAPRPTFRDTLTQAAQFLGLTQHPGSAHAYGSRRAGRLHLGVVQHLSPELTTCSSIRCELQFARDLEFEFKLVPLSEATRLRRAQEPEPSGLEGAVDEWYEVDALHEDLVAPLLANRPSKLLVEAALRDYPVSVSQRRIEIFVQVSDAACVSDAVALISELAELLMRRSRRLPEARLARRWTAICRELKTHAETNFDPMRLRADLRLEVGWLQLWQRREAKRRWTEAVLETGEGVVLLAVGELGARASRDAILAGIGQSHGPLASQALDELARLGSRVVIESRRIALELGWLDGPEQAVKLLRTIEAAAKHLALPGVARGPYR